MSEKTEILDQRKRTSGAYLRDLFRSIREALLYLATHFWSTCLVWVLIGISLVFPSGLWLLYDNVHASLLEMEKQRGFTIYMEIGSSDEELRYVANAISASPQVESIKTTTTAEALDELVELSNLPNTVAESQYNPLPGSVSVRVLSNTSDLQLSRLQSLASRLARVSDVIEDRYWVERTSMFLELLKRLNIVAAAVFGVSAILISSTTVRMAINERVGELQILNLVGTPRAYQHRLFQFCGLFYGIGGGLMTSLLLVCVLLFLRQPVVEYGAQRDFAVTLTGFDELFVGVVIGVGALLGILGASVSTIRAIGKLRRLNQI